MIDDRIRTQIATNWQAVKDEVARAASECGRAPDDISIVGVSKYVAADCTLALVDAGCTRLGESRPQSLWQKAESPGNWTGVQWHLIGHLQTNKIRRLIKYQPIIHSVDSRRLLECIANESIAQKLTTSVLLEVNISGDPSKTGLSPDAALSLLEHRPSSGVNVIGLMAMAGWGTDADESRRQFELMRQLRDDWQHRLPFDLSELSMGMSGDYREAIASGATIVRIGSRLFEGVRE